MSASDPLSFSKARKAVTHAKARYDIASQRAIQNLVGAEPDGDIGTQSVQAVARFQRDRRLVVDGMVGPGTLDALMRAHPVEAADPPGGQGAMTAALLSGEFIHLVADLHNLPVITALTIHLLESQRRKERTRFEAGMRVVVLGPSAFTDSDTLRDAISRGLSTSPPANRPSGPRPRHLNASQEGRAISHNKSLLRDHRAVRAVQHVVGASNDGDLGRGTVERIAEFQASQGLTPDGRLDLDTVDAMHDRLAEESAHNAIIRLLVARFKMNIVGALDLSVSDELKFIGGAIAIARRTERSNSVVRFKTVSLVKLDQGSRTAVHELVHVRQNVLTGDHREPADEFEAHSEELLYPGLPEAKRAYFFNKADTIISRFFAEMTDAEKWARWQRFERLRDRVADRFARLPPKRQAIHRDVAHAYENARRP